MTAIGTLPDIRQPGDASIRVRPETVCFGKKKGILRSIRRIPFFAYSFGGTKKPSLVYNPFFRIQM